MVLRADRIADFISDRLPSEAAEVQLLCEDHVGTYVLPFLCVSTEGGWANAATNAMVSADVLGWRPPKARPARRALWP